MFLCCYGEVFRSSHQGCSLRTPFLQHTSRRLLLSFYQKDIDNFIDCQTNESTKKIHIWRKKAKHGTERNELKCQLLKAQQRLVRVKAVGCFCRGAPSLMFGILNATLSEVSTTWATHRILNSPCFLIFLIHTKHKTIRCFFRLIPLLYSLEGELTHWVDKAEIV